MEIVHKPLFLILIVFVVFVNLTTFIDGRAMILRNHDPNRVDSREPHAIIIADLTHVTPVEHRHRSSGGFDGAKTGRDGHEEAHLSNGLAQGSFGGSYRYGYNNPYPGDMFGFPRGLFGFPRGLFGFPRGIFGFPGGLGGNPGVYGINPGGYGGYPGGYGGYPGGYDGGRDGDKPGGGGGYGGKAEVKGK